MDSCQVRVEVEGSGWSIVVTNPRSGWEEKVVNDWFYSSHGNARRAGKAVAERLTSDLVKVPCVVKW